MVFSVKGRILVTGASSGIGRATALRLAGEGVPLILAGRDSARLRETAEAVQTKGGKALSVLLDVTHEDDWKRVANLIKEGSESLSGLIHCAGENWLSPVNAVRGEDLNRLMEVNLTAVVQGTRILLPSLVKGAPSSVVVISSVAALKGSPGLGAYGAVKGALISWARTAAAELAPRKVRVNAIVAGVVQTPMGSLIQRAAGEKAWSKLVEAHLLGLGRPEDVAGVIAFLCSDDARWITGAAIPVDGGLSCY